MSDTPSSCTSRGKAPSTPTTLVYACSGSADTGEIADRAARLLHREQKASMSCLAGIGGRVGGLMEKASAAPTLLAIDGCPQDCARKTLELAGFTNVRHLRVTDLGFKKGQTPLTEEAIRKTADCGAALL